MVLGFDESNSENVTVNLKIVYRQGKGNSDEQPDPGHGLQKSPDKLLGPVCRAYRLVSIFAAKQII